MRDQRPKAPLPLLIGFGAFVLLLAYLVAASLVRPRVPEFPPNAGSPVNGPGGLVTDTVTIDARDEKQWQFVDLARGVLVPPDTAGWDLAFRRFRVITAGAAVDAGSVGFESLSSAPTAGYVTTTWARDTVNPVLHHWYRYSFVTHLLRPNGHVYVLRTRAGRFAKIEFLSYYCPGVDPGCVTFRYAYQPSGAPTF